MKSIKKNFSLCKIKFCTEMLHGFHKQSYYLKNNRAICLWLMWNFGLVLLSFWRILSLLFIFNYLVNWRIPKKDYFVPVGKSQYYTLYNNSSFFFNRKIETDLYFSPIYLSNSQNSQNQLGRMTTKIAFLGECMF